MKPRRAPLGGDRAPLVVTGFGIVSAAGLGTEPLTSAIVEGRSHIGPLENIDVSDLPNAYGAEIGSVSPPEGVPRFERYLELAIESAIADADADAGSAPLPRARTGVSLGTTLGLVDDLAADQASTTALEARSALDVHACAARVSERAGIGGPTIVSSLACASGVAACEQAGAVLALARADAVIVGGADTLGRFMQGGFCTLRGFSPASGDAPVSIALGESAALMVVEPLEIARARGARPRGVIKAQRLVSDGYHLASPDPSGDGMARAVALALEDAGLSPRDVGAVVVTAVGSPFHERMLSDVLARSLGDASRRVPVTSHELAVGHVLAASSIVAIAYAARLLYAERAERAVTCEALRYGFSQSHSETMPLAGEQVLVLSVGFGGFNGVTVVGRAP